MTVERMVAAALLGAVLTLPLPSYSKDTLLVTTNWARGNERVLLIDPENGGIRILWNGGGAELDAIVSPDGTRLYVTYIRPGGDELAVVDTASGAVLQTVGTPQLLGWIQTLRRPMSIHTGPMTCPTCNTRAMNPPKMPILPIMAIVESISYVESVPFLVRLPLASAMLNNFPTPCSSYLGVGGALSY